MRLNKERIGRVIQWLPVAGIVLIVTGFMMAPKQGALSLILFILGLACQIPVFWNLLRKSASSVNILGVLNRGPDPIIVVNRKGQIVTSNSAANELFNARDEGLTGVMVERLMPKAVRAQHVNLRKLFFQSNGEVRARSGVKAETLDGKPIEIEVRLKHAEYKNEQYAVASIRDISDVRRAEEQIKKSEKSFRDIFDKAAIGLCHVSLAGTFIRVNKNLCEYLGYDESELVNLTFQELTHPDDLGDSLKYIDSAIFDQNDENFSKIKRYRHKDGHYMWAKLTTTLVRDELARPEYFISSIQNISELKETEELLQQSERKFKTIVESISDEMTIWMATPGIIEMLYVNQGYEICWGRSRQSLYDNPQSFLDLIHPEDKERVTKNISNHQVGDWDIEYRIVTDLGEVRYIHDVGHGIYQDGELLYLVCSAIDRTRIMERQLLIDDSLQNLKIAYKSLEEASRKDGLTGILNRTAIFDLIDRAYERYKRYDTPATLVFIDLDRFKEVNDCFGHLAGDKTLIAVVTHIKKMLRQTDDIGRYGGDEFVVLLGNSNKAQAEDFCKRVGSKLAVSVNDRDVVSAGLSFGVCELSIEVDDVEQWISHADLHMYGHKENLQ